MFKGKSEYRKARSSIFSIMQWSCQQCFLCFPLPQAQGFEKEGSTIALSSVALFFLCASDILTNAEAETMLSHPALMLLMLMVWEFSSNTHGFVGLGFPTKVVSVGTEFLIYFLFAR